MIGGRDINVNSQLLADTQMFFTLYAFVDDIPTRAAKSNCELCQHNWLDNNWLFNCLQSINT
jgi:hypothetical protein